MELLYHSERPMTLSIVNEGTCRQIYSSLTAVFVTCPGRPHKPHEVRASNHTALRELRCVSIPTVQVYTCFQASRAWIRSSSSLAATSEGQRQGHWGSSELYAGSQHQARFEGSGSFVCTSAVCSHPGQAYPGELLDAYLQTGDRVDKVHEWWLCCTVCMAVRLGGQTHPCA